MTAIKNVYMTLDFIAEMKGEGEKRGGNEGEEESTMR